MSPREYRSPKRDEASGETRLRVLGAARGLLAESAATKISVPEIARSADVSRQTVYNTFGSKAGLLEALFDHLAEQAGMGLDTAFAAADEAAAMAAFTRTFAGFWETDRVVIRRLRGMAALDPELATLLRERDGMRRSALRAVLERFGRDAGADAADVVWQLTGFETYDALATADRNAEEVVGVITAAALAVLRA